MEVRDIKINRVCQEYLKLKNEPNTIKIFILSIKQLHINIRSDVTLDRSHLYIGAFICYIKNVDGKSYLIVYKLDCGILCSINQEDRDLSKKNTNTDTNRYMGHAISMITCNNAGFIVNSVSVAAVAAVAADENEILDDDDAMSIDDDDAMSIAIDDYNVISDFKNCSIYHYDWKKWKSEDYYFHAFAGGNPSGCTRGEMRKNSNEEIKKDTVRVTNFEYLYHRNIGYNSFIYVYDEDLAKKELVRNQVFDKMHNATDIVLKPIYDEMLRPYLYLFYIELGKLNYWNTNLAAIKFEFINVFNYTSHYTITHNIKQKGSVVIGTSVCMYKFTIADNTDTARTEEFISLLVHTLSDDVLITHLNHEIFIFIEYFRSKSTPIQSKYGGSSRARVARQKCK